jgi:hypothetical protein
MCAGLFGADLEHHINISPFGPHHCGVFRGPVRGAKNSDCLTCSVKGDRSFHGEDGPENVDNVYIFPGLILPCADTI